MSIEGRCRQSGFTLIELIMFIMIVSIALAGVMSILNLAVFHSADPMDRKQMLALAESLLEEVEAMPFTYCDPDDANVTTATSSAVGAGGCAALAEPYNANESRGGASFPYDNVIDYAGFSVNPVTDITGTHSYAGYSATVTVSNDGALGPAGLQPASSAVLRISVKVTHGSDSLTLEGYRARSAPNQP
ncbi:MAG TPA: prepilin-type N-terminal cleavage/methylation domain-containing protein [Rhodocyclaceae bacterium]